MLCASSRSVFTTVRNKLRIVSAQFVKTHIARAGVKIAMPGQISKNDPNSYANIDECRVTHLHLDLSVDFNRQVLYGYVDLQYERVSDSAKQLVLDCRTIDIKNVELDGKPATHTLGEKHDVFGLPLSIDIENPKGSVRLHYETTKASASLSWLSPQQTSGKKHPFVFSQNQAIHARSMVPCQDTPSLKCPFSATLRFPKELTAVMSGIRESEEVVGEQKVAKFVQKIPIPAYLLALGVGDLAARKIGPRSTVYAEHYIADTAAKDFSETESMLKAAEAIAGPYIWGEYNILVLPPSFAYGGMENPCISFVSPTIVTGDKSLVDVVAHEISHSWTGNLVTNCNWEHFWLNEGFTMFLERKILGALHGDDARQCNAAEGFEHLSIEIKTIATKFTPLIPKLAGEDPDDAFSVIPYEKGHTFLYYLEQLIGGPDEMDAFLKKYIEAFAYKIVNSGDFKKFFLDYFAHKGDVLKQIDWDKWYYSEGMPPVDPGYKSCLMDSALSLAERWLCAGDCAVFLPEDVEGFTHGQHILILSKMVKERKIFTADQMEKITATYGFDKAASTEIRFHWIMIGLISKWEPIIEPTREFIMSVGRQKYIRPMFRELFAWKKDLAVEWFQKRKPELMNICAVTISQDLRLA